MHEHATSNIAVPGLISFLRARLQDDWDFARDAFIDGTWRSQGEAVVLPSGTELAGIPFPIADHMARHDPARVFAEVEAKRRIIDAFTEAMEDEGDTARLKGLGLSIRLLASVYSDHSEYQSEWRYDEN